MFCRAVLYGLCSCVVVFVRVLGLCVCVVGCGVLRDVLMSYLCRVCECV